MYLGSWKINDYLVIPATTHRFSSGAAYDASAITYTIYKDDTDTEIVTATAMTKFDSETGFYLNKIQLLAATGFEKGKNYTILIKATIDSVAAKTFHTFQIEAEVDANIVSDKTGYSISGTKTTLDALNDISSSQVNAACDTALTDYDGPTKVELDTAENNIITEINNNETKIDIIVGIVTAILADTDELQTDWTNGGRLDLLIDSIVTSLAEIGIDIDDVFDILAAIYVAIGINQTEIRRIITTSGIANENITITRYTEGEWVNGHYVPGISIALTGTATIQPLNGRDLLQLAEGDRERESIKVFTEVVIQNDDELTRENGDIFELQNVKDWRDHLIPHLKAIGLKKND